MAAAKAEQWAACSGGKLAVRSAALWVRKMAAYLVALLVFPLVV